MKFEGDAFPLDLVCDEPAGLHPERKRKPKPKRPAARGVWLMRAAFLAAHVTMLCGFLAWSRGWFPSTAEGRDGATQAPSTPGATARTSR